MTINLIVLVMREVDVITGMDWLRKQWAKVNYYRKIIYFHPPEDISFKFFGNEMNLSISLILAPEAHQLLENSCHGYIAVVKDQAKEEVNLEEIPMIQKFPDVFLEELPGLPAE